MVFVDEAVSEHSSPAVHRFLLITIIIRQIGIIALKSMSIASRTKYSVELMYVLVLYVLVMVNNCRNKILYSPEFEATV